MKKLYILAPNDRFNYGDLLFSHILKKEFSILVDEIVFCSTAKSDFSAFGGIPTEPYKVLYNTNNKNDNYLIIAGGESLFVSWRVILSYIDKKIKTCKTFPKSRIMSSIAWHLQTIYMYLKYKPRTLYPYTIGNFELPNFKCIIYNSVGNCKLYKNNNIINNKKARRVAAANDYMAVRDKLTALALTQMEIKNTLVADSAILISKYFTNEFLERSLSLNKNKYSTRNYIYFQIGIAFLTNREKEFADILESIWEKYNIKICLGVIARAIDHEDHIALEKISRHLDPKCFLFDKSPNLWDIMWLIKNARVYIGTSLHGAITAMSFGTPICAYGSEKLKNYLYDWGGDIGKNSFVDTKQLEQAICKNIKNPQLIDISPQTNSVIRSFNRIKKIINQ